MIRAFDMTDKRHSELQCTRLERRLRFAGQPYVALQSRVKRSYLKFQSGQVAPAPQGAIMPRF
jgi:hypothetical protein